MKMFYVIKFFATLAVVVCSTGKCPERHIEKRITFAQSVMSGVETLPLKTFLNKQLNKQNYVIKISGGKTIIVKVPKWKPKVSGYNPKNVDWNSVISGCRATCRFDKRLCKYSMDMFKMQNKLKSLENLPALSLQRLKQSCENAKKSCVKAVQSCVKCCKVS